MSLLFDVSAVGYVIFVVKYFTSGYQHASVHTVKELPVVHQENAETQVSGWFPVPTMTDVFTFSAKNYCDYCIVYV